MLTPLLPSPPLLCPPLPPFSLYSPVSVPLGPFDPSLEMINSVFSYILWRTRILDNRYRSQNADGIYVEPALRFHSAAVKLYASD